MDNEANIQKYSGPSLMPKAPANISAEEKTAVEEKSRSLVDMLQQNLDNEALIAGLSNLGMKSEKASARSIGFLQTRVSSMLAQLDKEDAHIPKGLLELRASLSKINPYAVSRPALFRRMFGWMPFIGRLEPEKALKIIAARYQSIQHQIDAIMDSLYTGKDALLKDNFDLEQLGEQVKQQLLDVQKNAFLGEIILQKLNALSDEPEMEPVKRQKIFDVINDVAVRVQDLRTIEQANLQFLVSIAMTVTNNRRLSQTIDRTVDVTRNVITIGLSIQLALSRQKEILRATRETQEYAADVLAANAAAIREQGAEINEIYASPVIALDKVKSAYNDLMAAMDEAENAKREGIAVTENGIAQLSYMSAKLTARATGMSGKTDTADIASIEA